MSELIIRLASISDMDDIALISRTTWEGDDYLEKVAPEWIEKSSLYIGLLGDRGIGTFRIYMIPDGVLWLEALRVHMDFRGKGYGRELSEAALKIGNERINNGNAESMEFSTYFLNSESIYISVSQGFRVVNRFLYMERENPESTAEIKRIEASWKDFEVCPGHIPCGWKYPRACPEGMKWVNERAEIYRNRSVSFLMSTASGEFTPLRGAYDNPEQFFDGAEAVAGSLSIKRIKIILHETFETLIEEAYKRNYGTWDPVDGANVLVFRYDKDR
ncbi:MAG: GNAT family N-acetyltransferase [Candidatus Aegiribacteria sp.]|nr:GNAT family N-acetyltransferase [Candidatus Aegiribacteria sp.]